MIVPRLTDTVMAVRYEKIAAANARGLFAVVATTQDRPDAERVAVQSLLDRRVAGIIRTTAHRVLLNESPPMDGDVRTIVATPTLIPRKSVAAPRIH